MAFGVYLPTPAVQSRVLGYFEALAPFILPVTLFSHSSWWGDKEGGGVADFYELPD